MTAFEVDKKLVEQELRLLRDSVYIDERPHVIDLVTRLHRAKTPQDYFDLHLKLLARLRARQTVLSELKATAKATQGRIAQLAKDRETNRDELEREQKSLQRTRHQQQVQSALRFALLGVGDGLAWRALTYDRAGITVLGEGQRVAWLADHEGFEAEAAVIDQYWQKGIFAFHNDITTCIRHGDVTAIGPKGREVVEVKRGRKLGSSPQMRRLEAATTLLNTGRYDDGNGRVQTVVNVPARYRTGLTNLRDLFARARREAYAPGRIGHVQFVAAIDHGVAIDPSDNPHARALEKLGWHNSPTRLFEWNSSVRRMRERRHSFAGVAPFSIFPFPAEDVADLVLGYLDFYSLLNIDVLQGYLTRQGMSVDIVVGREAADRFMRVSRRVGNRELIVSVTPQVREQMLMELMTPASVAASLRAMLDAVEAEQGPTYVERVPRMDESRVWP